MMQATKAGVTRTNWLILLDLILRRFRFFLRRLFAWHKKKAARTVFCSCREAS